ETDQQAVQLIKVDYEDLPALLDPEEAARPGAPLVHEAGPSASGEPATNVRTHAAFDSGDVEAAFAEPGVAVYEAVYRTPRQAPVSTETHCAVAHMEQGGKVTIWASIKAPFRARLV